MLSFPGRIVGYVFGLLLLLAVAAYLGARFFSRDRVVIQPVPQIVEKLIPGETVVLREFVPGPIREIIREITKIEERPGRVVIREVSKPVELSPADLNKAREEAARRFDLRMEIPANQLIPCTSPLQVTGGIACGHRIEFRAEILEPKPGAFVPVILPGVFARPVDLTVTTKEEFTKPLTPKTARIFIYPIGVSVGFPHSAPHLVSGISYSNRLGFLGTTYEVRAEYTHPGIQLTGLLGWSW